MANNTQPAEKFNSVGLAIDYLDRHLYARFIFPIKAGKKFPPLVRDNLESNASNDPARIRQWAAKFPGCNWGVAHRKSKLLVVDVDCNAKKNKKGQETYDALALAYDWPDTEQTVTPSGGFHKVYQGWADARHEAHIMALGDNGLGVDIDSPNYTIIPGCVFEDGTSYVGNGAEAVRCPEWIYDVILTAKQRKRATLGASAGEIVVEIDQQANIDTAIDFLQNDAEPAIQGKGGDGCTFRAAAYLKDLGISVQRGAELMNEYYNPRCEPAWDLADLMKKMESAYSYGSKSKVGGKTAEADFADDPITKEYLDSIVTAGDPAKIEEERRRPSVDCTKMHELPVLARKVQRLVVQSAQNADAKPADQIFQRVGALVHLSRNRLKPDQTQDKSNHVDNELMINEVEKGWLADRLERGFRFYRIGKKKGASGKSKPEALPINAPAALVERLQAIKQDWSYPGLIGTVEAPTLRADGSVLNTPGYDVKSGLYFDPGLVKFPEIDDRPSRDRCMAALDVLKKPLADFPFADEDGQEGVSRSVALAMMLTAVCRRSLRIAPMFGIDANEAQSGKTELAQVAAILMTGRRTAVRSLPTDEYQRSNTLAAAFGAGDACILYDNVDAEKQALEGEALCMSLTDEIFSCRRLGGNSAEDQIRARTNSLLMATGNKLTAAGDMAEDRLLLAKLRPGLPLDKRKFTHWPLGEYVTKMRPALVAAALTILRGHLIAPAEERKAGPKFRFPEWRAIVADALVWLGEPDPVRSTSRVKADDPVKDAMRDVMREWIRYIGEGTEVTTASLITKHPDVWHALAEARRTTDAKLTKDAAVRYLKGMVGIDLLGYRLDRTIGASDKLTLWSAVASAEAIDIERAAEPSEITAAGEEFGSDDGVEGLM